MADKIKISLDDVMNDNIELPENFMIVKIKSDVDLETELQGQIDYFTAQLGDEPTPEDLLASANEGVLHPYYETKRQIAQLQNELSKYKFK